MKTYIDDKVNTLVLFRISSYSWISKFGSRYEKSCRSKTCKDDDSKYKFIEKT